MGLPLLDALSLLDPQHSIFGGWVFGSSASARIAAVSDDTSLSQLVSAQALANNGMTSWTVGQFRQVMTNRLGSAANQAVLTLS